jgi:hypothetical protein
LPLFDCEPKVCDQRVIGLDMETSNTTTSESHD